VVNAPVIEIGGNSVKVVAPAPQRVFVGPTLMPFVDGSLLTGLAYISEISNRSLPHATA
jgi:hypothetical protein